MTDAPHWSRRGLLLSAAATGVTAAVSGTAQASSGSAAAAQLDIVLTGGTVIDGTGRARYLADVGIKDGTIARIGDLSYASASKRIDATGLVVAPGFIDLHTHPTPSDLPVAEGALRQGVTTALLNPDGFEEFPISKLSSVEDAGLGQNVGAYAAFDGAWSRAVGEKDRRATQAEIAAMQQFVTDGLRGGAWGVSLGLDYMPQHNSDTDEVIKVLSAARDWRTNTPNHIRNEDIDVVDAVAEHLRIGEHAGLVPIITHHKIMHARWGKSHQTLALLDQTNARGTYAAMDQYPYPAAMTNLEWIVPRTVLDGGRSEYLKRFADSMQRPTIAQEIEEIIRVKVGEAKNVSLVDQQRTLADAAKEMNVSPGEATMRIIEKEEGWTSTIYMFGDEADIERIMRHPLVAVASDGGTTTDPTTHPRHYGTNPRVLGRYVRERGVIDLETAVRKMTGLPATLIGMVDRGYIAEGMAADLTVFDPDTIIDRATFEKPKQYAQGVEHVIINGTLALIHGKLTNARAGKVLRREGNMISRRETGSDTVRASTNGRLVPLQQTSAWRFAQISFHARSHDGDTTGHLVLNSPDHHLTFTSTRLGKLQVADDWASITGRGRIAGQDDERSFVVIVDDKDPLEDGKTVVTVKVAGGYSIKGAL
ncbi:amidohydrolase family protein [Streptomyces sp. 110]|uniref:Amidohydrolase family protein n=1 Tax=Streptomyces endocoffeicus TaxID=2898945 RepID=A0ABS1Q590_9ACTN|nr:amidohydrolase family protein [Streptomyces endocoffeicus]MBL1119839.1 amidohydrolase family protein [Streptomyces endocoffeicus]